MAEMGDLAGAELERLAREVAAALGDEWTAAVPDWIGEGERVHAMHLAHSSGVRLSMSQEGGYYSQSGKVEISTWDVSPREFNFAATVYVGSDDPPSADIRVSYSRGAAVVAREIMRRLWDRARARHEFVQREVERHLSYQARVTGAADEFERLMPEGWRRLSGPYADAERPEFSGPHRMKANARSGGVRLALDLVDLSPQVAAQIVALIAEHEER